MKSFQIHSKSYGTKTVYVDDEDFNKVAYRPWNISTDRKRHTCYARGYVKKIKVNGKTRDETLAMHRFIMNCPKDRVIDHIDGNGLNNQKSNLRICTQKQNMLNQKLRSKNTSGFKGVHFCNREKKWVAAIAIDKKKKFLGYFKTKEEAHDVWVLKAKEVRGEFYRGD